MRKFLLNLFYFFCWRPPCLWVKLKVCHRFIGAAISCLWPRTMRRPLGKYVSGPREARSQKPSVWQLAKLCGLCKFAWLFLLYLFHLWFSVLSLRLMANIIKFFKRSLFMIYVAGAADGIWHIHRALMDESLGICSCRDQRSKMETGDSWESCNISGCVWASTGKKYIKLTYL